MTMMRAFGWKDTNTAKAYIRAVRTESAQKAVMEDIFDLNE